MREQHDGTATPVSRVARPRRGGLVGLAERGEGVRIFIGKENKSFSLSGSSLIIAPFQDRDQNIVGVLGVITGFIILSYYSVVAGWSLHYVYLALTGGLDLGNAEAVMPAAYRELMRIRQVLERHYHDMQDIEFTIEKGKLWMLQTRDGKRTAQAAVRIAVEMAEEGLITREEAIGRVTPEQVDFFLHPQFDPAAIAQAREDLEQAEAGGDAHDDDVGEHAGGHEGKDPTCRRHEHARQAERGEHDGAHHGHRELEHVGRDDAPQAGEERVGHRDQEEHAHRQARLDAEDHLEDAAHRGGDPAPLPDAQASAGAYRGLPRIKRHHPLPRRARRCVESHREAHRSLPP